MLRRIDNTWYGNEEGTKKYLRVTRALEVINKPGLMYWAASAERKAVIEAAADLHLMTPASFRRGSRAEYIERLNNKLGKGHQFKRVSKAATDIGSETHNLIEAELRREMGIGKVSVIPPPSCVEVEKAIKSWRIWREQVEMEPLFIESTVWSDTDEYAGTADLMAKVNFGSGIGTQTVILDWKTSKGIYPEMLLQNAAYVRAYCEMGHGTWPMPGILVRLPKTAADSFETRIIKPEEQEKNYKAFQSALHLAKHLLETSAPIPA